MHLRSCIYFDYMCPSSPSIQRLVCISPHIIVTSVLSYVYTKLYSLHANPKVKVGRYFSPWVVMRTQSDIIKARYFSPAVDTVYMLITKNTKNEYCPSP